MHDLTITTEARDPVTREFRVPGKADHGGSPPPKPPAPAEPEIGKGKLAPYLQLLSYLVQSQPRAKIRDFYLRLCEQGYIGSYDLVKKKIHSFRKELGLQAGLAFASADLPQGQVEVGKVLLKGGGGEVRAFLFTMVLGHSGRFYAELLESCEMGRFLQAHQNAFEAFAGVPKCVLYDPQENPLMRRLVGGYPFHLPVVDCGHHYGYSALPTPAFAPWMKGRLKRPAKIIRKLFLPGHDFHSIEATNLEMQDWLSRYQRQNGGKDRVLREKVGALPITGFNFLGRRQFLKLRA